ncbi:MAG: CvpA family protein, partial [Bacteroidales bacterium]|nr:CvpA family protein [Bacteroidales bacterium]
MPYINAIDILIILLFIPAVINGIRKGFIRQLASLAALLLGIWAASLFHPVVSGYLCKWFSTDSSLMPVVSFAVIFIVILLIVSLLGRLISGLFRVVMLGWLDKLAGFVFSIAKTALLLSILIYVLNSLDHLYNFMPKESISRSKIYRPIEKLAPAVFPFF